jgi:hypothetical protein
MAVGNSALKKRNLKPNKLKKVSSPGLVADLLAQVERLQRQVVVLTTKLDNDTGVTDTNYQATINSVK